MKLKLSSKQHRFQITMRILNLSLAIIPSNFNCAIAAFKRQPLTPVNTTSKRLKRAVSDSKKHFFSELLKYVIFFCFVSARVVYFQTDVLYRVTYFPFYR